MSYVSREILTRRCYCTVFTIVSCNYHSLFTNCEQFVPNKEYRKQRCAPDILRKEKTSRVVHLHIGQPCLFYKNCSLYAS